MVPSRTIVISPTPQPPDDSPSSVNSRVSPRPVAEAVPGCSPAESPGIRWTRRACSTSTPAPVVARALGCHDETTTRLVTEAGRIWSRYAPGDHSHRLDRTLILRAGGRFNRRVAETDIDLGAVPAPSGVLVLGMASWIDHWTQLGRPLSERAGAAASIGGGHVRDWMCEMVAVPAAGDTPLTVRAGTTASPFDGGPTIAVLEIDLGLPWAGPAGDKPIILGDLPVDRCGMVLGDALALDSWTGDGHPSTDGLADVTYWGGCAEAAHHQFGGELILQHGSQLRGWLDLPLHDAEMLVDALNDWEGDEQGQGVMVAIDEHTDFHRFNRASWTHPLQIGAIEVAGCPVLGINWDGGDHSMRHRGERRFGQVYPVTLQPGPEGQTMMRWTIPPYAPGHDGTA